MAGLQQYNFFPTDLLYPRQQPSPSSSSSSESTSIKPSTLPVKNPNLEISQDLRMHEKQRTKLQQQHPSKHALFYDRNKKMSRISINPLSLAFFIEDDVDDSLNN